VAESVLLIGGNAWYLVRDTIKTIQGFGKNLQDAIQGRNNEAANSDEEKIRLMQSANQESSNPAMTPPPTPKPTAPTATPRTSPANPPASSVTGMLAALFHQEIPESRWLRRTKHSH
jgi:hypothetical protein